MSVFIDIPIRAMGGLDCLSEWCSMGGAIEFHIDTT